MRRRLRQPAPDETMLAVMAQQRRALRRRAAVRDPQAGKVARYTQADADASPWLAAELERETCAPFAQPLRPRGRPQEHAFALLAAALPDYARLWNMPLDEAAHKAVELGMIAPDVARHLKRLRQANAKAAPRDARVEAEQAAASTLLRAARRLKQ